METLVWPTQFGAIHGGQWEIRIQVFPNMLSLMRKVGLQLGSYFIPKLTRDVFCELLIYKEWWKALRYTLQIMDFFRKFLQMLRST